MLGIKNLKTGEIVKEIEGYRAFITMMDGDIVIFKLIDWDHIVPVPRGVDYDVVAL